MTVSGRRIWLAILVLHSLGVPADTSQTGALLEIRPPAFLPQVTQSVQLTCRPSLGQSQVAQVVTLELFKLRAGNLSSVPLASYVTAYSPAVEALGAHLGASASGSYDPAHPEASFLDVTLPQPTNAADGVYSCVIHTLDTNGLLHSQQALASLVSLAQNGSVPDFYQVLLKELRNDLDSLHSDLDTVQRSQDVVNATDVDAETKLSDISRDYSQISALVNEVNTHLHVIDQTNASLHSQLDNLSSLTPETPVNFYAYLSTASGLAYSVGNPVVFNAWVHHSDNSYSTSTGVFTAPYNGTYFFRTGLAWDVAYHNYASITINGGSVVASLYAIDDYSYTQASASAVVELTAGDRVSVVKKGGQKVYGTYSHLDHVSYFMGMLLW